MKNIPVLLHRDFFMPYRDQKTVKKVEKPRTPIGILGQIYFSSNQNSGPKSFAMI